MRTPLLILLAATFAGSSIQAQSAKTKAAPVGKSTTQKVVGAMPDIYRGRQIIVGGGGGVTGYTGSYYLLDDGRLYGRHTRDKAYKLISTQPPATIKRLFSTVENQCKIKTTKYNEPGNMSRFVAWRKGRYYYKVTWAAGDANVPAEYPKFYSTFMALIPAADRLK